MMGSDITNEAGEDLRLCVSLPTSSTHNVHVHALGDVMIIHVQVLLKVQDKLYTNERL